MTISKRGREFYVCEAFIRIFLTKEIEFNIIEGDIRFGFGKR